MELRTEMIKIAHYYYDLGYNQQEIADRLNMSRQRVNRLLKRALDDGIVEIQVHGYKDSNVELESQLETRLGLREVRVVDHGEGESFGACVMDYLEPLLTDGINVGVSFGSTLAQVCSASHAHSPRNLNVVQLLGGINSNSVTSRPDDIVNRIAAAFGAKAYNFFIPAIVDNLKLKEMVYTEEQFQPILELYKKIDIAVMPIGAMWEETTIIRDGYLRDKDYAMLQGKNAVGDIALRFLDIDGNIVDEELNSRVTGISTEELKAVPLKIGLGYGWRKVKPIVAAVRGGFMDVLITDVRTARLVLECTQESAL